MTYSTTSSLSYRLSMIVLLFIPSCADLDAFVSRTPPSAAELSQLNSDRENTLAYVIQCLKDERELVDKRISRLNIEKLSDDYSNFKAIDDSLIKLLSKSIIAGSDPSADYLEIKRATRKLHENAVYLQAYAQSVAPVRRNDMFVVAKSNELTYKYYNELPKAQLQQIWQNWQLRQATQRSSAQEALSNASLPLFKTLADTFGP
jgi:hypothetical protein